MKTIWKEYHSKHLHVDLFVSYDWFGLGISLRPNFQHKDNKSIFRGVSIQTQILFFSIDLHIHFTLDGYDD